MLALARELDFQGLMGDQFGRFFGVFLRGAFQEASGGVFFRILVDSWAQWGVHWGPCGPIWGVQMRGIFLGNVF